MVLADLQERAYVGAGPLIALTEAGREIVGRVIVRLAAEALSDGFDVRLRTATMTLARSARRPV